MNSVVHHIRLHGPWDVTALEHADGTELPPPAKMPVPCSWAAGDWPAFRGRALHARHFGKPTNLSAEERVWLVIEAVTGSGEVRLNGSALGIVSADGAFARDITDLLEPRNRLEIELTCEGEGGGVTGEVRLEIWGNG
jgi:hypothetical protein